MNLIWINSAKYLGDYRLSLSFSNGEERIFDAQDFIQTYLLKRSRSQHFFQLKNLHIS